MYAIQNNKGMAAQVINCVYGDSPEERYGRKTLYSLSIAGSHTAVKAIWASVISGSPLRPKGFAHHKVLRAEKDTEFLVIRTMPLQHVHHYQILVDPKPSAPYLVITSQLGLTREDALVRFLSTYTLYPVIQDWADVLFGEGSRRRLVRSLETCGLAWAYRVEVCGWDKVLDGAAKSGMLTFPKSN